MEPQEVRRHLEETGGLLHGHFQLSSGLHSTEYFQCARLLAWPARAALMGCAIGELWKDAAVDVVVGPAMGGILIAHEVARFLGAPCLFSERLDGRMTLRRGFSVDPGARVLVVEDVVTTGKSAREVMELLRHLGAELVGVSSIVWRAPEEGAPPPFDELRFQPLLETVVEAFDSGNCPSCQAGQAFEKPGSRPMGAGAQASYVAE